MTKRKRKELTPIDQELVNNVIALFIVCGLVFATAAIRTIVDYIILVCYK